MFGHDHGPNFITVWSNRMVKILTKTISKKFKFSMVKVVNLDGTLSLQIATTKLDNEKPIFTIITKVQTPRCQLQVVIALFLLLNY